MKTEEAEAQKKQEGRSAALEKKSTDKKFVVSGGIKGPFAELDENAFGIGSFFDASVSYEDAVKNLNTLIKKGTAVEYNGIRFVKDKDGNLFCDGKPVTPDSREKMIKAYDAVRSRLQQEDGATID